MYVCADCGNKRCPRATFHGYQCNRSNEPGQEAVLVGAARMDDEIAQIKADPAAYFASLPRPERLSAPKGKRRLACWLLRCSEAAEAAAYRVDDRAWASRWGRQ